MSSAIDYVRYSCGIAGEDVANYVDELEKRTSADTDLIEQLTARVRELEEENARLKAECDDIKQIQFPRKLEAVAVGWKKRLAAEQLNNKLLRDALEFLNARIVTMDLGGVVERALSLPASTEALDAYVAEKVKDSESRTGNQSPCYTIARDMAVRMWEKHYKTDAPNWEPLDDFMGVLSQISNMLTGLGNVEEMTRQRNLAVEAMNKFQGIADMWLWETVNEREQHANARKLTQDAFKDYALSTIKESEGK